MPLESDFRMEPFRCGACGAKQLVDFGDPNDQTLPDVDAVECCFCGTVETLDDDGGEATYVRVGEPLK